VVVAARGRQSGRRGKDVEFLEQHHHQICCRDGVDCCCATSWRDTLPDYTGRHASSSCERAQSPTKLGLEWDDKEIQDKLLIDEDADCPAYTKAGHAVTIGKCDLQTWSMEGLQTELVR
jgi:hypothetical protein